MLIDGYQKRCALPLVCKRWNSSLLQPSFVWATLHIGFHELWDVEQVSQVKLLSMAHSGYLWAYLYS